MNKPKLIEEMTAQYRCPFIDSNGKHPWTAMVTHMSNGNHWKQCMAKECGWVDVPEIRQLTREETINECMQELVLPENEHGEFCDMLHCGVDCPTAHAENSIAKLKQLLTKQDND